MNQDTTKKGFIAAGLMNIGGVLIFSRPFTNEVIGLCRKTPFWASVWLYAMLSVVPFPSTTVQAQSPTEPDLEEIVIPIRVHILRSAESSHLNCICTEVQITAWFDRANTIWRSAAIRWDLESFVYEEANNASEFDRVAELGRDADP